MLRRAAVADGGQCINRSRSGSPPAPLARDARQGGVLWQLAVSIAGRRAPKQPYFRVLAAGPHIHQGGGHEGTSPPMVDSTITLYSDCLSPCVTRIHASSQCSLYGVAP